MVDRSKRIVDTAVLLAEEGGFDNVRLREVAARSGVALGTLYTRFKSKEDILIAALEQEVEKLVRLLDLYPTTGDTPKDRVNRFFELASRTMFMRPNFGKAVLRAVASGDLEVVDKVAQFHQMVTHLIMSSYNGHGPSAETDAQVTDEQQRRAFLLQQIWFASLVGWMSGLHPETDVFEQMSHATGIIIDGTEV